MLLYSGFLNALLAPLVLYFVIRISANSKLMRGNENNRITNYIGWFTMTSMAIVCTVVFVM
jgi:Mn2+/Fe2+ NRAMP family transporter